MARAAEQAKQMQIKEQESSRKAEEEAKKIQEQPSKQDESVHSVRQEEQKIQSRPERPDRPGNAVVKTRAEGQQVKQPLPEA